MEVTATHASNPIQGQYIVRLKPGASASGTALPLGVHPLQTYKHVFDGFAARLTPAQLNRLRFQPSVAAIEQDALAYAFDSPPRPAGPVTRVPPAGPTTSWGLDRIDQRRLPLNGQFNPRHTGAGVTAYMIDSGIDPTNTEFSGRLLRGYTTIDDGYGTSDCLGHGTMTAGIVGGTTWGVVHAVKLVPVRVLGCDGSGAFSGIIAGFDWVAANAVKPAVANASLGGSKSDAANAAATALADSGVFVSVAAGNSSADACDVSPASAPRVLTLGASDITDAFASFSNTGPCVDMIAPGVNITSARLGGGSTSGSGTSFAAPYATGVGALFKSAYGDYATATVLTWLVSATTPNVLKGVPSGTNNRLLYSAGL